MTRPQRRAAWRLALALALAGSAAGAAAPSPEAADLLRAARLWDARQRPEMARSVLHKLLLIQPDSADGLLLLGDVEARAGNAPAAEEALRRLEQAAPRQPAAAQLRTIIRVTTRDKAQLARARLLARAGQAEEAMALLRTLMPEGPPPGELGLEYYQTLGATAQGAATAQAALADLARRTGEWRYTLARLELLGSRQPTRQEAARGFAQLSRRPDVDRRQLVEAWTWVLNRLSDSAETIPFLESYVAFAPEDTLNAERLAKLRALGRGTAAAGGQAAGTAPGTAAARPAAPVDPSEREAEAGLDALSRGELDLAYRLLTAVQKKRPRDPDVAGGIGRTLMRQGREDEARKWLAQAASLDPVNRQRWVELGRSAEIAGMMRKAEQLDDTGRPAEAERIARSVLAMQPDSVDAMVLLGSVRMKLGDPVEAERLLRDSLRREPDNGSARRALVRLLVQQNRRDEVMTLIASDKDGQFAYVQAGYLRDDADKLAEQGRRIEASDVLLRALALQPGDPWIRFSLARLYARMNLVPMANRVMSEGLQIAPNDPSMIYATALYLNGQDNPREALALLARIRPQDRSAGMHDLYKRASVALARRQAAALHAEGRRAEGDAILMQTEQLADGGPDDARAMAEMWFSADQPERGLAWMRKAAGQPGATPEVRLYYAGLLNRARRDDELARLLPALEDLPGWTQAQTDTLFGIKMDLAERRVAALAAQGRFEQARAAAGAGVPSATPENAAARARLLSEAGDAAGAVALLREFVAGHPDDVAARMELARNLGLAGQNDAARREAREGLHRAASDDVDNRLTAVRLLVRINQFDAAREVVGGLLRVAPDDPSVLVQAGRVERADRRYGAAMRYFEQAREKERLAAAGADSGQPAATVAEPPMAETAAAPAEEFVPAAAAESIPPAESTSPAESAPTAESVPATEPAPVAASAPTTEPTPSDHVALVEVPDQTAPMPSVAGAAAAATPETAPLAPGFLASLPQPGAIAPAASTAQREIDAIEARRMPRVQAGLSLLRKNSSPGLSSMHGEEVPVVGYWPIGYQGHAFVQLDRVSLDAGHLPPGFGDAALFGQVQAAGSALPAPLAQRARGSSAALGYEGDDIRADIGVVGMGFPVTNVVGGVLKTGQFTLGGDRLYGYAAEVARRPVTSTLLSYAGTRDPVSGAVWGGVVQTGGSVRVSTDLGPYGVSASAGYSWLTGRNVQDNRRFALRTAIDRDLLRRPGMTVNAGLALTHWRYAENQNYLTFGHGGYYSPQRYTALSAPLSVNGRSQRLTYAVRGAVSLSRSSEKTMPFYPTLPALQAQAAGAPLPPGYAAPYYDGGTGGGLGYSLRLAAEYRLAPQFVVGGLFNIDRSSYYNPVNMLLYLRYYFAGSRAPDDDTPTAVIPYSQY